MTRSTTPKGHRDIKHPGAGTLYVHGIQDGQSPRRNLTVPREPPSSSSWDEYAKITSEPCRAHCPDELLERGIDSYTFIPAYSGGSLGQGKFSCVYKVQGPDGKHYALKHTPLHPHHPLIAARLLREPTLLSLLPAHPNLIGVHGTIRTQGHFYLIEQYAANHVPLNAHPLPLAPSRAAFILDQLVSVLRDCLHKRGRVVHRDLKGENVLVDVSTGEIILLDLGLATHYSASEPKLTTCCGSPAFHSPEIVRALAHPPGEVSYYGPELDIWCIALTLLSLLLQVRFPLGPSHKSTHVMRERAIDRLQELDEVYPPSAPWRNINGIPSDSRDRETTEWKRVRSALRDFLEIDGMRRMAHFDAYQIGPEVTRRVAEFSADDRVFKSVSFQAVDIRHTLPIYLQPALGPLSLSNSTHLSERKVVSYLKYILRSRGILYHRVSDNIFQLVLPYPNQSDSVLQAPEKEPSWVSSLFIQKRSISLPPKARSRMSPSRKGESKEMEWVLKCYLKIECSDMGHLSPSSSPSPLPLYDLPPVSPITDTCPTLPPLSSHNRPARTQPPSRAQSVEGFGRVRVPSQPNSRASSVHGAKRPHPLSRQVSREGELFSLHRHVHHAFVPKITLTLSDPRGYGILRKALDVKHEDGHTPPTPTVPIATSPTHSSDSDEGNRGRPRSKEDSSVLVSEAPTVTTIKLEAGSPPPGDTKPRDVSRGRSRGFLDGWFGLGVKDDVERTASTPPVPTTTHSSTTTTSTTSTTTSANSSNSSNTHHPSTTHSAPTHPSHPNSSTVTTTITNARPARRRGQEYTQPSVLVAPFGY